MFNLYFTNITDRGLVDSFATLAEARAAGNRYGFEYHVMQDGRLVGSLTIFGGWRDA
jgi:hypothetical protein